MTAHLSYNAQVIADSGCSNGGITTRRKNLTVIGYGERLRTGNHITPFDTLPGLLNSGLQRINWDDLAAQKPENLVALMSFENYLYLNPVHYDEHLRRFVITSGTMFGGNYATGDSRFNDVASALLHTLAPETRKVRHAYPLAIHDRIEP